MFYFILKLKYGLAVFLDFFLNLNFLIKAFAIEIESSEVFKSSSLTHPVLFLFFVNVHAKGIQPVFYELHVVYVT